MRLFSFVTNPEQFDIYSGKGDLNKEIVPNDKATVESVCDAFIFIIESEDETNEVVYNRNLLIKAMTEKMVNHEWYKRKSAEEQKEILRYINEDLEPLDEIKDS